jgi:hypothetical protein
MNYPTPPGTRLSTNLSLRRATGREPTASTLSAGAGGALRIIEGTARRKSGRISWEVAEHNSKFRPVSAEM